MAAASTWHQIEMMDVDERTEIISFDFKKRFIRRPRVPFNHPCHRPHCPSHHRWGKVTQARPHEAPVGGSLAASPVRCEEASVLCMLYLWEAQLSTAYVRHQLSGRDVFPSPRVSVCVSGHTISVVKRLNVLVGSGCHRSSVKSLFWVHVLSHVRTCLLDAQMRGQ